MQPLTQPRPVLLLAAVIALALAGCGGQAQLPSPAPSPGVDVPAPPNVPGLIVYRSAYDVPTTVRNVQDGLAKVGMVAAVVDHAASAATVGKQLRPTTVVIGANPRAGTPLMAAAQTIAVDLPQKYLVWQAEDGVVHLGYNSAEYLAGRAGLDTANPALDGLRTGSAKIAADATGSAAPVADGGTPADLGNYLVTKPGSTTVPEAIAGYRRAFAGKGLEPAATVDHASGATSIGGQLRPTQVIFVGNPAVGTTLIQASQTMGIDLPVRYLVWQDAGGVVRVGHPDIRVLAARHQVTGADADAALLMVETASAGFTAAAADG